MKKYDIIYADPPWHYRDKAASGKRGAIFKYPSMTDSEIQSMNIESIASDNCFLFLWATAPRIESGIQTIKSWGFRYVTFAFVWIKQNKKNHTPFWGMGNYTRANSEPCLLGIRGKPKRINAGVHQLIFAPVREHSQKPDETRDKIVKLCGDQNKIELFARQKVSGWECWGNQVDGIELNI